MVAPPLCCLKVRNVEISDLKEVYDIELKCFREDPYPFKLILFYFTLFRETFIVIECINKVIGYAIGVVEYHRGVKRGHIISIAIHPLYQGLGLGKILLKKLEEILYLNGATYIYLEVRETNKRAISLYRKLGYRVVKRLYSYYRNEDGLLMAKHIGK